VNRLGRASAVGIELAVAVIGCLLLGTWLDDKLGTAPWMAVAGIVLGSVVGLRAVIRAAGPAEDEREPPPGDGDGA
jgi:F0F1-type ATP synthase assembly protein I